MKTNEEILEWVKNHSTDFDNAGLYADFKRFLEEGIMGNNQGVPSNLPSKEEFTTICLDIWNSKDSDTIAKFVGLIYDWLVSKMGEAKEETISGYCKVEGNEIPSEEKITSASISNEEKDPYLKALKDYFDNAPKEQIERDWDRIQSMTPEVEKEPAYKEIDFSMEEYKKYPDCLYLKSGNSKLEELVKFNTARDYNQYAATLNGRLILIRSGNDMYLRVPVKKVKKVGWVNIYPEDADEYLPIKAMGIHPTKDSALEAADKNILIDTVRIEWTETEEGKI